MHPTLELFLEEALSSVQPTSREIKRVVVEPDYDAEPEPEDAESIASQLIACIEAQPLDSAALASSDGIEVMVTDQHPTLKRYVRQISLHSDQAADPWIEIVPPGNWI